MSIQDFKDQGESVRRIDEGRRTSPPDAVPTSGWTQAPPALDDREIDQAFEDYAAALDGVPTAPVPTIGMTSFSAWAYVGNAKVCPNRLN